MLMARPPSIATMHIYAAGRAFPRVSYLYPWVTDTVTIFCWSLFFLVRELRSPIYQRPVIILGLEYCDKVMRPDSVKVSWIACFSSSELFSASPSLCVAKQLCDTTKTHSISASSDDTVIWTNLESWSSAMSNVLTSVKPSARTETLANSPGVNTELSNSISNLKDAFAGAPKNSRSRSIVLKGSCIKDWGQAWKWYFCNLSCKPLLWATPTNKTFKFSRTIEYRALMLLVESNSANVTRRIADLLWRFTWHFLALLKCEVKDPFTVTVLLVK